MRLSLYQPDIPQNTGAMVRVAACFAIPLDIIEPAGFTFTMREIRRVAMDYAGLAEVHRHINWSHYVDAMAATEQRLILLSTKAAQPHTAVTYQDNDALIVGREQAGVPPEVHDAAALRVRIPMSPAARSLNVSHAAAIVLAEALRQRGWPEPLT